MLFIRYVLNYGFVKKEPSGEDKIEKASTTTLSSDRILKHQYCARNYQHYSELVQDLLQVEKHDELTIRNNHQHLIGTTPLSEVNYSWKSKEKLDGQNNHPKNFGKSKKGKKTSTRIANPNTKVRGKTRNLSSATIVVVLIILQRSVI
jgi:hypothetical protein